MISDYGSAPLHSLAREIRLGKLDPVELVRYYLDRIDRYNPQLNALRYVNRDGALKEAAERGAEARAGKIRGRLHGLVFTAKDNLAVAGLPRSDGTLLEATDCATEDSGVIAILRQEGAICIGKSNMPEYGKSYFTENDAFGRTNNPFDPTCTPGGSSGGEAAALAADFASFGIGGDSGGSIRVPAAYCGIFGMFPSEGAITTFSTQRMPAAISRLFLRLGPFARSLADLELLTAVLARYDARDPVSQPPPLRNSLPKATKRFAYYSELRGVRASAEIRNALKEAVSRFERAGYSGVEQAPPPFEAAYEVFLVLAGKASMLLEDLLSGERGSPRDPASESSIVKGLRKRLADELPPLTPEIVLKCWHLVDRLRNQTAPLMAEYDFVLAPISATTAVKHGTSAYEVDGQSYQSQQVYQFASAINVLGLPALAFPAGVSRNGLPIGLQAITGRGRDFSLFELLRTAGYNERIARPSLKP